jgi:hypothetical protein
LPGGTNGYEEQAKDGSQSSDEGTALHPRLAATRRPRTLKQNPQCLQAVVQKVRNVSPRRTR